MGWTPLFHARECPVFSTRLLPGIAPSTVFQLFMDQSGKILRHWKDPLNISKLAQFVSDTSQANEDIALQSGGNLQTFVWWGGASVCPSSCKRL